MNKIITTLLLLTTLRCFAMESLWQDSAATQDLSSDEGQMEEEVPVQAKMEYEQVVRCAKHILESGKHGIDEIYQCHVSLDMLLRQLQEGPHEGGVTMVLEVRGCQHKMRKLWVKKVVDPEAIDERRVRFCVANLKEWATTLNNEVAEVPSLVLASCVEAINLLLAGDRHDKIQGVKKFLKQFALVKKVELAWKKYLKERGAVTSSCLDQLQAVREEVKKYNNQCVLLSRLDGDDSLFQVALAMKRFIKDAAEDYLEREAKSKNDEEEVKGAIPDAEEHIESILMNAQEVIDSLTIMIEEWNHQLITKRNDLRRGWAELLLQEKVDSKDKRLCEEYNERLRICILSFQSLKVEIGKDGQLSQNVINLCERMIKKLASKIEKAEARVAHAQMRLDEAVADRESVITRVEECQQIKHFEEGARPYKIIVRARDAGNEKVEEAQQIIENNRAHILALIPEICKAQKIIVTEMVKDNALVTIQTDRLDKFYAWLHKMTEESLKAKVCKLFRDKEGIKDDYTDKEYISLIYQQHDAFIIEGRCQSRLDEEQRTLTQEQQRLQSFESKKQEAEARGKERGPKLKAAEDMQEALRKKIIEDGALVKLLNKIFK